ncbi:exocyst complex component EXO70E2-like [Impatiens glandulifera]|uniref:exocyst complex component EXO70E2-like n=1 Tax=Impatiens glandulifera TaxID=253017 RepID=UPI001FB15D31|nr:exocyst complex component EXO70E2-like [Impatiens glandulifera]
MHMGECQCVVARLEGGDSLIKAVEHIVKALKINRRNLTNDERKILADLGSQLTSIANMIEEDKDELGLSEVEKRFNTARDKIMNWELDQSMIWDSGSEEVNDYLKAVGEVREVVETLEGLNLIKDSEEDKLLRKTNDVLQTAMARLEEEFTHLLINFRQPSEPGQMSFRSSEEDVIDAGSTLSFGDESVDQDIGGSMSISRNSSADYIIDLVHPSIIPDLKCIANLMFDCNYDRECTRAFVNVRRDALDDCLYILEIEKSSIEDVLKMEWGNLSSKIKKWVRAMKIFVRVYLASEKWLSDQIFEDLGTVGSISFAEASKASILQLLNFGEAIAIGPFLPEKLISVLNMYEVLSDLVPEIDAMFTNVKTECQDVLARLGICVKATFDEFKTAVASKTSTNPFAGGGIHPITKYVMNYIKTLTDYSETLNLLLKDTNEKQSSSPFSSPDKDQEDDDIPTKTSPSNVPSLSAITSQFGSLISILETNLEDKSKLYKSEPLSHIFLMNNIRYVAEKVKGSELRTILGDEWTRKRNWKVQHHAMGYERATWSSILTPIREREDSGGSGSGSISKTLLKERLQSFYVAFEEVYKSQSGWLVPDEQLREDIRISTSLNVVQAYRNFVGRHVHNHHLSEKNIKYTADDLENCILDLFEGAPRSLRSLHKK